MSFALLIIAALMLFSLVQIPAFLAGALVFWLGVKKGKKQ
jgi:hypothetical protein